MFEGPERVSAAVGSWRALRVSAWLLIIALAIACGEDGQPGVEGEEPEMPGDGTRGDGGPGRKPGTSGIGTLGDGGLRRDGGAAGSGGSGADDHGNDAGDSRDAGDGGDGRDGGASRDGGAATCEPAASAKDDCDGVDTDCDGEVDEDFVARPCDGDDADKCADGTTVCTVAGLTCSDDGVSKLDVCNGADDDCDPATADGSAEATLGDPCDGTDSDLCTDGVIACTGGSLRCSDDAASKLDVCNGSDDDCDPASADGSEDPMLGADCDGDDDDACLEGKLVCNGTLSCNDPNDADPDICNAQDDDCDGKIDEAVVHDTNPSCASNAVNLGSVAADSGEDVLHDTGVTEKWLFVNLRELDTAVNDPVYLSATISLLPADETDYDLFVYCDGCGGALAGESDDGPGIEDIVDVRAEDTNGDDSFLIAIEIRHYESNVCAAWDLLIEANTIVDGSATCN